MHLALFNGAKSLFNPTSATTHSGRWLQASKPAHITTFSRQPSFGCTTASAPDETYVTTVHFWPHLVAKSPEPPHVPNAMRLLVLVRRPCLEANRRVGVEVNPPGPLQHRRVVRFFGAVNDAVQTLCLRKPDADRAFGREDAVRDFRMHWTFDLLFQLIF
ncbi:hypothetical protein TRVL_09186 [Trypanosoma vivax]|nr:hypothetical protein TRVL_09186 [Trypanosoma vivax]